MTDAGRLPKRSFGSGAGLYVHVPFCSAICPYCDFAVMKGDAARRQGFVEVLLAEIELIGEVSGRFDTVYFGGGTPSMLETEQLALVIEALRRQCDLESEAWIGLEANPEDASFERLAEWRSLGVQMLSLGVQSFDAANLDFLGRVHGEKTARRSIENALQAGFETVSVDLIYGLPEQTVEGWRQDLDRVAELAPHHISCYQLTVHAKTVFGVRRRRGQFVELADARQAELYFETHERLAAAGYEGYEVSNFSAAPEHRSRHNVKYWDHTPYLGLGPSAHSFDGGERWWNESKEGPWSRKVRAGARPIAGRERLAVDDLAFERLMLGLRTVDGVDVSELEKGGGFSLSDANRGVIEELERSGKVVFDGQKLRPTLEGMAIADTLALAFDLVQ